MIDVALLFFSSEWPPNKVNFTFGVYVLGSLFIIVFGVYALGSISIIMFGVDALVYIHAFLSSMLSLPPILGSPQSGLFRTSGR